MKVQFPGILILLIFFLIPAFAQNSKEAATALNKIEKRAQEKYLADTTRKAYRFEKDTVIQADTVLDGNVVIVKGNLTVRGHIMGDVLAIRGNVLIKPGAQIDGNVTSVEGRIVQDEKSFVAGNQIETKAKNLFSYFDWENGCWQITGTQSRPFCSHSVYGTLPVGKPNNPPVIAKYNRVQGLFLGLAVPKKVIGKHNLLSIHGFAGYGFREKQWNYQLGADRWLFNQTVYRFELGASVYDYTDSKDNWYITPLENSLAAFLIHEDFQDFYRKNGYSFHVSQNLSIYFKGSLTYSNDQYKSVKKNADWALFGGKKKFRENPAIDEGNMRSLRGELYLDTRNHRESPTNGWYAKLSLETSNSKLNSDFSFNQYLLDFRRYQPLGDESRFDLRVMAMTSEGTVPAQRLYQLGGVSTLRGFKNKALHAGLGQLGGDRLLLANLEYTLSPQTLGRNFLFCEDIRYVLFFDAGNVWQRAQVSNTNAWNAGFDQLKLNSLKSDLGIAVSSASGKVRLSLAKRLDTNYKPLLLTFRISKPF